MSKKTVTYFNGESGRELVRLPIDAVKDCSHSGACDQDVEFWVKKVEFIGDKNDIRACLKSYGAWDDDELLDDEQNRHRILWIAACDINENPESYPQDELDLC